MKARKKADTKKLVTISLLWALVAVLSVLGNFIRFGPFPITLALCPIIVGGAMFGAGVGAQLGTVFGVVTLISGLAGWDGGGVMLMFAASPLGLFLLCILKGTFAGLFAALAYNAVAKTGYTKTAVIVAGIVCPVTNTGLFILGMLTIFRKLLYEWAGGTEIVSYIILSLTGINFVVELVVNMVLAAGVTTILKYANKQK